MINITKNIRKKSLFYCILIFAAAAPFLITCAGSPSVSKEDSFSEKLYARLALGDVNGALSLFGTLSPEDAAKTENLLMKASILISAERLTEARQTVQTALENDKNNVDAKFILSKIEGIEGKTREQKALLESIVKTEPHFVPALNALGDIELRNNRLKPAGAYFESALKVEPKNLDALIGRAAVYRFERRPKDAVKLLGNAVDYYPDEVEPLAQRGRIYREMGNLTEALADLDKAKTIDKNNYWLAYDRGRTLLAMNKKRDALVEFQFAEKINPNFFASYIYSAGIHDELQDYKNAIKDYQMLARLKPDYYFAFEMLGIHYMGEKRYEDARGAFMSAFEKSPEDYRYALLAVINGLYAGEKQSLLKPFIETVMRKIDRTKPDYYILRLFYDFSGDADIARRTSSEKDLDVKAKNLFYLANYYKVRGNGALAQKFFSEFKDLQRKDLLEWRIYEWTVENNVLGFAGTTVLGNS